MAEEAAEIPQKPTEEQESKPGEDMELEAVDPAESGSRGAEENGKRGREGEREEEEGGEGEGKRPRVQAERSVEEARLEKMEEEGEKKKGRDEEEEEEEEKKKGGEEEERVRLGPKEFDSAVEMFDYFFKLMHSWSLNLDVNKYEYMVLLDLLKKGHPEPDKKIGEGIQAFQIRYHPLWKSRCFFLVRNDGSVDDFSFRKCVDHILPLPENMKPPFIVDGNKDGKKSGGHQKGGGRRRGHGGRGGGRGHGRRGGK